VARKSKNIIGGGKSVQRKRVNLQAFPKERFGRTERGGGRRVGRVKRIAGTKGKGIKTVEE